MSHLPLQVPNLPTNKKLCKAKIRPKSYPGCRLRADEWVAALSQPLFLIHFGLVADGHNPVREIGGGGGCILGNFPCGQALSLDPLIQLLLLCSLLVILQGSHGLRRSTESQACFPSINTVMSPWLWNCPCCSFVFDKAETSDHLRSFTYLT